MKRCKRLTALLACALLLCIPLSALAEEPALIDYAGSLALDMQSETAKQQVTVSNFVDGDTTHFAVPESLDPSGVLKARYIAINTPESTGKIEEWGKKASSFTREKLENAEAILIESDTDQWNSDSTSTRDLVWVWYKPAGEESYRNLNVELLQNGLALANNAGGNRYGETCLAAVAQARANKLHIYSGEKDPDFFYGDAIELTIRELRLHPEEYSGKKVAFSGVITQNHNNSVYLEALDEETGMYFGFPAYYGFNLSAGGMEVLHVGNEARIVGTVQYYEAGQAWQVSGLNYRMMRPNDPGNIQKLSEGHDPAWTKITPEQFWEPVALETDDGTDTRDFAALAQGTSVSMTVKAELVESPYKSLLCLECSDCGPSSVKVYVPASLTGPDGQPLTQEALDGKTLLIRGFVDNMEGYCVRVFTGDGLTYLD